MANAKKCIRGILSTGDGTADKPYQVTRVSDEYDVLGHLGILPQGQSLTLKNGKAFDRLQCGGSELWFDVTSVFKDAKKNPLFNELMNKSKDADK